MSISGDQFTAIALLGVAMALGIGMLLLLALLARLIWRWMTGAHTHGSQGHLAALKQEPPSEITYGLGVTTADLFTIRSNLNAVSHQIEDLERKLRLGTPWRTSRAEPARK